MIIMYVNCVILIFFFFFYSYIIWKIHFLKNKGGPTNFAPIIRKISNTARVGLPPKYSNAPLARYYILTIITDGEISDMESTKSAIIEASDAPLSIIIVGVGKSSFASMIELDGDENRLCVNGKYAERDIVQFVPLS